MHSITIAGTIGESVTADGFRAQLDRIGRDPVTVRINSSGGSVQHGAAIYEALRSHPAQVTVEITGWALSIASFIAMAGRVIRIAPAGVMMLHNPWITTSGDSSALRKTAGALDVVRASLLTAYRRSGASESQITRWLDAETWFSAEQALAAGLADELIAAPTEEHAGVSACVFSIPDEIKEMIMQASSPKSAQQPTPARIPQPTPAHITQPTPAHIPQPSEADAVAAALAAEKARRAEVRREFEFLSKLPGFDPAVMTPLMRQCEDDESCTAEAAGKRILVALARDVQPIGAVHLDTVLGYDSRTKDFQAACADVLLSRAGVTVEHPHPCSHDVQRLSIAGMAENILSMHGRSIWGMGKAEIIQAALHTSDFPGLLANTAGRALRAGYESAPATHAAWTAEREVNDFKPQTLLALSEAPSLERVDEGAEYTSSGFSEAAETFSIETFGRIITITRQALVNDDLGAFTRIPLAFGASARRLEADRVYAKLTANPVMADGKELFHADHGNIGTAAALSVEGLGAARAAMRRQKGIAGLGYFDPQPRFLIVPVALETEAESLLASLADPSSSNSGAANPSWVRGLVLIADPRLDASSETAWYLAADPRQIETIIRAYLASEPRPYLEENAEFVRDVLSHKCRMDFGVGVIDYRGLFKNPGV